MNSKVDRSYLIQRHDVGVRDTTYFVYRVMEGKRHIGTVNEDGKIEVALHKGLEGVRIPGCAFTAVTWLMLNDAFGVETGIRYRVPVSSAIFGKFEFSTSGTLRVGEAEMFAAVLEANKEVVKHDDLFREYYDPLSGAGEIATLSDAGNSATHTSPPEQSQGSESTLLHSTEGSQPTLSHSTLEDTGKKEGDL